MAKKVVPPPFRAFFRDGALGLPRLSSSGHGYGVVHAIHKVNSEDSPYCVVNEIICGTLGRIIGLPVPPCALTLSEADGHRRVLFTSMDFNECRDTLPPVVPDKCILHLPEICAGILAFDILIANPDRAKWNACVDRVSEPSHINIWDHERALFGCLDGGGIERLRNGLFSLGLQNQTEGAMNDHIFLDLVEVPNHLAAWANRIRHLPLWIIEEIVDVPYRHGLLRVDERKEAIEFLTKRSFRFESILAQHKHEFTKMQWSDGKGELFKWPQDS